MLFLPFKKPKKVGRKRGLRQKYLQKYRDTNGRRIVIQIGGVCTTLCQEKCILLQKYRDRNGRCIAILFKCIRVRGRFYSPDPKVVCMFHFSVLEGGVAFVFWGTRSGVVLGRYDFLREGSHREPLLSGGSCATEVGGIAEIVGTGYTWTSFLVALWAPMHPKLFPLDWETDFYTVVVLIFWTLYCNIFSLSASGV